jgi:hypothetical protein
MTLVTGAVLLAALTWGAEERLTTTTTDSETGLNHRSMAVDAAGRLHVVWAEQNGPRGNYQVMTRRRPAGGPWGAAELVVPFRPEGIGNLLGAKYPALVAGAGDSLHLVWHDYRHGGILNCEIYCKAAAAGAPWDTSAAAETRLTTTGHTETNGDNGYVPSLAAGRDGNLHVAWYDFRYDGNAAEILAKSRVAGGWDTAPGDAADANVSLTAGDSQFPDLAIDGRGGAHCVWQDDTGGNWRIYYAYRPPAAAAFEAPMALTTHGFAATTPVVAVDGPGRVTVAWADAREGSRRIRVRTRDLDGSWGPDRPASPAGFSADEPALAVDEFARTWLAWHDTRFGATNREVLVQAAAAGAAFDSTGAADERVSSAAGASGRPTLLAPGDGTLHVLYRDRRDGNNEIYHREATLPVPVGVPDDRPDGGTDARPGLAGRLRVAPNPVRDGARVWWEATRTPDGQPRGARTPDDRIPEGLVLDVIDAAGRRHGQVALTDGSPTWWRPLDGTGARLPAGTYWLRARPDGPGRLRAAATRVVVVQ